MPKKKTHEEFIADMSQKHPDINVLGQYQGDKIKIKVQHSCGHVWEAKPNTLLQGHGCPECAGIRKKTHEEFIEQIHQHRKDIDVLGQYINARSYIKVQHSCGHIWEEIPSNLLRGANCPECRSNKKTHEEFVEQVHQRYKNIDVLEKYQSDGIKIKVQHSCGYIWKAAPSNLLKGHGCPQCAKHGFHPNQPATFYVYEIIKNKDIYYGFGISNIYEVREKKHLRKLTEAGANITNKWLYPFASGYECKGLEDDLKAALTEAGLNHNLGIKGFITECAKEQAKSLIMRKIQDNKSISLH